MKRVAHRDAMIQVDFIASRHQPAAVNPGWARYAQLTYSPAVRAGEMLFIAGHTALDQESAMPVHPGDVAAQAAYVYENILRVVAAAGGGPEHLAKTVEYITPAALERYREVGRRALANSARALSGLHRMRVRDVAASGVSDRS